MKLKRWYLRNFKGYKTEQYLQKGKRIKINRGDRISFDTDSKLEFWIPPHTSWGHMTVIYDNGSWEMYIDGVLQELSLENSDAGEAR